MIRLKRERSYISIEMRMYMRNFLTSTMAWLLFIKVVSRNDIYVKAFR